MPRRRPKCAIENEAAEAEKLIREIRDDLLKGFPTDNLRRVAYHEAAHAVIGWLLGARLEGISVVPDKDAVSQVLASAPPDTMMIIAAAGAEGERLFCGKALFRFEFSDDDMLSQRVASEQYKSDGVAGPLRMAKSLARIMLMHHWSTVDALAERLVVVRKMDREQLLDFLVLAHSRVIKDDHFPREPIFEGL